MTRKVLHMSMGQLRTHRDGAGDHGSVFVSLHHFLRREKIIFPKVIIVGATS